MRFTRIVQGMPNGEEYNIYYPKPCSIRDIYI